jgi:hypothetical protein
MNPNRAGHGVFVSAVLAASLIITAMPAASGAERQGLDREDGIAADRDSRDQSARAANFDDLVILDQFGGSTFITSVDSGGFVEVGPVGTWPATGTRLLGGDLHGDNAGDAVIVRRTTSGFQLWGIPWNATANVYDADARTAWAVLSTGGFSFDRSRQLMGDVTGDGLDDVVTVHRQLTGGLRVWVHPNTGTAFGTPQQWQNLSTGGWSYDRSRQTLADVNNDGMLDLVSAHRQLTGGLILWVHLSNGTTLAAPTQWQNLSTGGWSFDNSRQTSGDVNGDGLDDIVSSHRLSTGGLALWAHLSNGTSFAAPSLWQNLRTGGWSYDNSQQRVLDWDLDGSDDVISAHRASGNLYRLWLHVSTGTSFQSPALLVDVNPTFLYDGTEFAVSRPVP